MEADRTPSAAQGHADTIRRAIYANGPQEWEVPIAALDALLTENARLCAEVADLKKRLGYPEFAR